MNMPEGLRTTPPPKIATREAAVEMKVPIGFYQVLLAVITELKGKRGSVRS